jgi:hypothetical protein
MIRGGGLFESKPTLKYVGDPVNGAFVTFHRIGQTQRAEAAVPAPEVILTRCVTTSLTSEPGSA